MPPEKRECPLCHFQRIPYVKRVCKNKKHYLIYTCPLCGGRDIDAVAPRKLWNGTKFEDESYFDENVQES